MNSGGTIINVTPSSFEPLVRQTLAPVLLLAYKDGSPSNSTLRSLFAEASQSPRQEALFAWANLAQYPELARLIGNQVPASLMLYWGGIVQFQFLGHFTRHELQEVLARAETLSSLDHVREACKEEQA